MGQFLDVRNLAGQLLGAPDPAAAYVEKLVPDQNEYFSANPLIPADSQKFANVRNWFRTVQIAAD